MQHYKHARKKTLQPHYEPFDIMGGGDKRYRLISSVLAAFAAGQSRPG